MAFIVTGGTWQDHGYYESYSNPQFDSGARSVAELTSDGSFTFTVGQATGIVCGLNAVDLDADYLEIEHAFYIENGRFRVVENGVFKTVFSSYTTGAVFKIERIGGVVKYYVDSILKYTSLSASIGTVFLDCSLYAANDTIILGELVIYEQLELDLPKPTLYLEESLSLEIELLTPDVILLEADGQLVFELPKPALYLEETLSLAITLSKPALELIADEDMWITLPKPELTLWTEDTSTLIFEVPKPTVYIRETLIVPDYSILQFSIPKPQLRLNEEENLSLEIELQIAVALSLVADYCYITLPKPLVGMQEEISNFFFMEWPKWTLSFIIPHQPIVRNVFQFSFKQINSSVFESSYSLMLELESTFESIYELLTYDTIQSSFTLNYQDSIQHLHRQGYSDYSVSRHSFSSEYADNSWIQSSYVSSFTDYSALSSIQSESYSDYQQIKSLLNASYKDFSGVYQQVTMEYCDNEVFHQFVIVDYSDYTTTSTLFEYGYSDFANISSLLSSAYSDRLAINSVVSNDYSDRGVINSIVSSNYSDRGVLSKVVAMDYSDTTIIGQNFTTNYSDYGSVSVTHPLVYNDYSSMKSFIVVNYASVDLAQNFDFSYGLLDSCEQVFTSGYLSEAENLRSLFLSSYSLNAEPIAVITGSCWIELNGQTIAVNEVSINADEGSVYYQCSATIINEIDYRKFVVDTEFTVHLFGDEYRFIVDSKNLSRSIDDEGHLSSQMTIEGLSPIVRSAAPRASTITKTWDEPTLLSAFITELLGPVDYRVVDDYIPAYRLSAENAIPLELAKATMESIGALIESLPDGSIKVRKLWPTSIIALNMSIADHELNDENLFSMSESQENNDWRNKFRIIDVDASVQDTLEFVVDEDNDLSGTLYAYPSPWRDGLTLRHTRGTPIYLSALTEEVVEITVDSEGVIESELIEFQEGESSTRYPMESILSFTWLAADLGAVAFVSHTKSLKSSAGDGYSLAEIRYTTRRLKARTSSSEYTSAQYLLEEI